MLQFTKELKAADLLVAPFWAGKKGAEIAFSAPLTPALFASPLSAGDFKGKEGELLLLYPQGGIKEKRLLLVGIGPKSEVSAESFRKAYGAVAKASLEKGLKSLNLLLPELPEMPQEALRGVCEGLLFANYAFDRMKEKPAVLLEKVGLVGVGKRDLALCANRVALMGGVNLARDLVSGNADDVNPDTLVESARAIAREFPKVKVTVFRKKELEKQKMGLLLAVNRGSLSEPALILLEYSGNPSSKEKTALVGKGITYDTGGLNLKPTGSMETMKSDMAGSAVVLGTLQAAATLGLSVNLVGVIAATENAIGPDAYKPGDVYRSYLGKSVEISNTDAEGRLVLADALAYTEKHYGPTRMIDFATLTGAVVIALGEEVSGLYSNDDAIAEALSAAGEQTYERVWRMPLYKEYRKLLNSKIADIKNAGNRQAGSITAAVFLQEFVAKTPWAHLDIAGTAYLSEPKSYHPTHATGVGVRLMIAFLERHG